MKFSDMKTVTENMCLNFPSQWFCYKWKDVYQVKESFKFKNFVFPRKERPY